jgi:hypothetical protein
MLLDIWRVSMHRSIDLLGTKRTGRMRDTEKLNGSRNPSRCTVLQNNVAFTTKGTGSREPNQHPT